MRIPQNAVFSDLTADNPALSWTVYDPQEHWDRPDLLTLPRGSILIQLADDGIECFGDEIVALWYKRSNYGSANGNGGMHDWALIVAMPLSGTVAPVASDKELCAQPIGAIYVKTDGESCIDQLYVKAFQFCGQPGECNDWVPLFMTLTQTGNTVSYDSDTHTLNIPVGGRLMDNSDDTYTWTPDNGATAFDVNIPFITYVPGASSFAYNRNDGTTPVTIPLGSTATIPDDLSGIQRPWVKIGEPEATNEDNVLASDNIWHMGKMVRGAISIGSAGADAEFRNNVAVGSGNHTLTNSANVLVGGDANQAINTTNATIFGGTNNVIDGTTNPATYKNMFIGSGANNRAEAPAAAIVGGNSNVNSSNTGFIGAGAGNDLSAGNSHGLVAGTSNEIQATGGSAFIGAGSGNTIGPNGQDGAIPGGRFNQVNNFVGVAAGIKAKSDHAYAIVFCTDDAGNPNAAGGEFASTVAKEFAVKAIGGFRMITNAAETAGMYMTASTWTAVSDRRYKENLQEIDPQEVLEAFEDLPVYNYNYIGLPDRVDAGPMAQDFYEAFGEWCETRETDGKLTIDDSAKVAMLMAAVSGLLTRVKYLEHAVSVLGNK